MKIVHFVNLWTLTGHPTYAREWSLDKKIAAVAAAGFTGITSVLTPAHRRLAEKHGIEHLIGYISSSNPAEFAQRIREQKEAGAVHINVQMDDHDTPPALAVKHWLALERHAAKIGGVIMSLEVHRDICTETPEKTYEIAERYRRATGRLIRFTFDFSHLAVVKHLNPANYAARLLDHPALLQHSVQCHCRPFNGHHCQVPVTHRGKLSPEVKSYLPFVEKLFRVWKSAPGNADRTLFVCPELGCAHPDGSGYNISGLPPAWPDAVILRRELQRLWNRT